jgi:hypothetical protein
VTIVTATGQRATSGHLPDFGEMARNPATSEERRCEIDGIRTKTSGDLYVSC